MHKPLSKPNLPIHSDMTVLDIVSQYRETEQVFERFDQQAGECICCKALFEPLRTVADRYGLDLTRLLDDLNRVAHAGGADGFEVCDEGEKDS